MNITCHICGDSPANGVALYRQNAPGELPAVWACIMHNRAVIDPEVDDIVTTIEQANRNSGTKGTG